MKNIKYLWLLAIALGLSSCNDEADYEELLASPQNQQEETTLPALTVGTLDFSNYVAVGASFTSGFTDGALFKASQENSFPNLLSKQFATANGGVFNQPLMNDNIGGLLLNGTQVANPRFFFNGSGPALLPATPTTEITASLAADGSIFNNVGIPGAKSVHVDLDGYAGLNPYFGRFANSPTVSMLDYAVAQNPTFFTLSDIGGNDVLDYATSGGGDDTKNITPSFAFDAAFNNMINELTAVSPKGVVTNVPYIDNLPHFTTVPHNPLNPKDEETGPAFAAQVPLLNQIYGAINPILGAESPSRAIMFSDTELNAVVIKDESLPNIAAKIIAALNGNPNFPAFVASFGLPAQASPTVANLLGITYGQARPATANDLLVLLSSKVIGTVNMERAAQLMAQGVSQTLAGQLSVEGVTLPLEDKWVLVPGEQEEIRTATDKYNETIETVATEKGLALVDFKAILTEASTSGLVFDNNILTTDLVTGGLVSLDGVHLTARGYALLANKFLAEIDATYGSNFVASGNITTAEDFNVTYSPMLP